MNCEYPLDELKTIINDLKSYFHKKNCGIELEYQNDIGYMVDRLGLQESFIKRTYLTKLKIVSLNNKGFYDFADKDMDSLYQIIRKEEDKESFFKKILTFINNDYSNGQNG